jgi:hypothetical protein
MQKNSPLNLPGSHPLLPGRRIAPHDTSGKSSLWSPLMGMRHRWKQHRKSTVEPTTDERLEIEAQISHELYPKKI